MRSDPLDNAHLEYPEDCFVGESTDCTGEATMAGLVMDGLRWREVPVCAACARLLEAQREQAREDRVSAFYGASTPQGVQEQYAAAATQKVGGRS